MKYIIFMVLLSTMLFSAQKQIILGNFSTEVNAKYDVQRLHRYIEADSKLAALFKERTLEVKVKKIDNYSIIAILPFSGEAELLRAKRILGKYYFDLYSIEYIPNTKTQDSVK